MGRSRRVPPARLAEKLRQLRTGLELSQSQMLKLLPDAKIKVYAAHISEYETGKREPPLPILLGYARAAGVPVELLIDDEQDLPPHLPAGETVWVLEGGRLWSRKKGRT